jgi:hypothetical protein
MTRLTDNDRHIGGLTYARSSWNPLRLVFSTGGGDEGYPHNHVTGYALGWVARLRLPKLMQPWRRWVDVSHYDWAKSPDAGYWDVHAREYGFSLHEGFLQLFLGAQTHDSLTTQSWSWHLPWTQWRHIRTSFYDAAGKHFWTEWARPRGFPFRDTWDAHQAVKDACPAVKFEFDDYDGQRLVVTTRIDEREWRFGEGWFKWLSVFCKPMTRRSLDLNFSSEVGPEKGSWKGGTCGTDFDMLPGELHEAAFRRYCEQEHRSKYQRFKINFVGAESAPQPADLPAIQP